MDKDIQGQNVLNAYIKKFGAEPQKVEQLINFSKQSKQGNTLRYSQARKLMRSSKSKSRKKSPISSKKRNATDSTANAAVSVKRQSSNKAASDVHKPCQIKSSQSNSRNTRKNSNLLAISSTELTPNIESVDSSENLSKLEKVNVNKFRKDNAKREKSGTESDGNAYSVGDRVKLAQDRDGIIRYIGTVDKKHGIFYGVELLDGSMGLHDGTIGGKRYFQAPKKRGIFVKVGSIRRKIKSRGRLSSLQLNREAAIKQKEQLQAQSTASPSSQTSASPNSPASSLSCISKSFALQQSKSNSPSPAMSKSRSPPPALQRDGASSKSLSNIRRSNEFQSINLEKERQRAKKYPMIARKQQEEAVHAAKWHKPSYDPVTSPVSVRTPQSPALTLRAHRHSFKSEKMYIHRDVSTKYTKDGIDNSSMSLAYRKASLNLHRNILQKVNDIKSGAAKSSHGAHALRSNLPAFSTATKMHSPMVAIRVAPILTFANVPAVTTKMSRKPNKRESLVIHKRPSLPPVMLSNCSNKAASLSPQSNASGAKSPFSFSEEDEEKLSSSTDPSFSAKINVASPITFSPRTFIYTPQTPAMTSIPPLAAVTINYVEMQENVNQLVEILLNTESEITDKERIYKECHISQEDRTNELHAWIDLLCTHSKLFEPTKYVKAVSRENAYFAPRDYDAMNPPSDEEDGKLADELFSDESEEETEEQPEPSSPTSSEREKEKQEVRKRNKSKFMNHARDFDAERTYYYTVFERLLFELHFFYLYFIYDIGLDNCHAFSELHPSSMFLLSGNITQILRKCSPVLNEDIGRFFRQIVLPHHLKIRYKYLNRKDDCNIVSMVKYASDGLHNDYNFVGRIQHEEMLKFVVDDKHKPDDDIDDECGENAEQSREGQEAEVMQRYASNLEYELIVYTEHNTSGMVIYKSVIPNVLSITSELSLTNLKRTIIQPSLIFQAKCHIECEKWSDEGDYYGFIRMRTLKHMVINKDSVISASECGYFKQHGFGVGSFKNDFKSKTKYYSGGGYGTASESPHELCPAGKSYGEDCLENNYLYYGSPCFDDNERAGGIIDILCGDVFVNYGRIECRGANGMQFGGSSGGSIKIVAKHFINYGVIDADGGNGATYQRKGSARKQIGTKGGAGRIFIICKEFVDRGSIIPQPVIVRTDDIEKYDFSHIKSLSEVTTF